MCLALGFFKPFGMVIAILVYLFGLFAGCFVGVFDAQWSLSV
ncbi:hypothetical protein [Candidatus Enterovibrio escicola]|nr:hypothetical protein [Candidatus Enterovibrio escacola]